MSVFERYDELCEIDLAHKRMLRATILGAPRDRECLANWLPGADLDAMDHATLRLVPGLVGKFGAEHADDPRFERLWGVYRYWQFRNRLVLADGRRAIERLRESGIELLLFKGVATVLKYYGDPAVRPMGDVDVLLRAEDMARGERVLLRHGWMSVHPEHLKAADVHSHDYLNARRSGFDLHWHSLYESARPGVDAGLWQRAQRFDWDGLEVRLLSPEDLLLIALVNGLRDVDPMRLQWIVDVARILAAEPRIDWSILWEEAGQRGLRVRVFDALNLARDVASDVLPGELLRGFVERDADLQRDLLVAALAEGRTYGLARRQRTEMAALLGGPCEAFADAPGAPRHVRFFTGQDGSIVRLFLQRRHLPLLGDLFEVRDAARVQALVECQPPDAEVLVELPPGVLAARADPRPRSFGARIALPQGERRLEMTAGESRKLALEIENASACCWAVGPGARALFGASYHLCSESGEILAWDFARTPLLGARSGYVAFIEPGQRVAGELTLVAPLHPGRYRLKLDVVQEHVAWFSREGCRFPEIDLEVRERRPAGWYAVDGATIFHETRSGETAFIDTVNGVYFSATGFGPLIWNALVAGHEAGAIVAAFESSGLAHAGRDIVLPFVEALLAEGLIAPCGPPQAAPSEPLKVDPLASLPLALLTRHEEPAALIAMHPMSGVNPAAGWPHAREP